MSAAINITVEGGTQEQAGMIGDLIHNSLTDAGFSNLTCLYANSDPEEDITKALRNLNPEIFDTPIEIDAIGEVNDEVSVDEEEQE